MSRPFTKFRAAFVLAALIACSSDTQTGVPDDSTPTAHNPGPPLHIVSYASKWGDGAIIEVGTSRALSVQILIDGLPGAGIPLSWTADDGTITPNSVADQFGVVTVTWALGTAAGQRHATVSFTTATGDKAILTTFSIKTVGGPATGIARVSGDAQSRALNAPSVYAPLTVRAQDRYGNAAAGVALEWEIEGPFEFTDSPRTTAGDGYTFRSIRATGEVGTGRIHATLAGASAFVDFAISVTAPERLAIFQYDYDAEDYPYGSAYNFFFSAPPQDTIPVGWGYRWRFPGSGQLRIISTGPVSFPNSPILQRDGEYAFQFTVPGTYAYQAEGYPRAVGTIVVK